MSNSPSARIELSDALASVIAPNVVSREDSTAAHEFAASYAHVAKQKEIPRYLGLSPDADYLTQVHRMPFFQPTERVFAGSGLDSRLPSTTLQMPAPSDLIMLANSIYQNKIPTSSPTMSSPEIFQYNPTGFSGNYSIN